MTYLQLNTAPMSTSHALVFRLKYRHNINLQSTIYGVSQNFDPYTAQLLDKSKSELMALMINLLLLKLLNIMFLTY